MRPRNEARRALNAAQMMEFWEKYVDSESVAAGGLLQLKLQYEATVQRNIGRAGTAVTDQQSLSQ